MNTQLVLSLGLLLSCAVITTAQSVVPKAQATAAVAAANIAKNSCDEDPADAELAMGYLENFLDAGKAAAPQWSTFVDEFCALLPENTVYRGMHKDMMGTRNLTKGLLNKRKIYNALMGHKDLIPGHIKTKMRTLGMSLSGYIKLK